MKKILFALIIVAAFIPRGAYASKTSVVYSNAVGDSAEAIVGNSQPDEIKLAANASICDAYANHAIHLQRTNLKMKCGLTGARWHLDYNLHFKWCMSVADSTRAAFVKAGGNALKICPAQKIQKASKTFRPPIYKGHVVDNCVFFGTDCGDGGANKFCEKMGYRKASAWEHKQFDRTRIIGTGGLCTGPGCTGYSFVTCVP